MIERFIETQGTNQGRIKDAGIAYEAALTEDAWRNEGDGPILPPPERVGKSRLYFRDLINSHIKQLIAEEAAHQLEEEFDQVQRPINEAATNPEASDEAWLSWEIANTLWHVPHGEAHGLDEQTCNEIAAMPFAEAFETAYGYAVQGGLDPEEILAPFLEQQEQ